MLEGVNSMQSLLKSDCEKVRQKASSELFRLYMFQTRLQPKKKQEEDAAMAELQSLPEPIASRQQPVSTTTQPAESYLKSQTKKMFAASVNSALNGHPKK